MSFFEAIKTCLAKYFVFSGRASRAEYWWFWLFYIVGMVATFQINRALFGLFFILIAVPIASAGWRRMHDVGQPGYRLITPTLSGVLFSSLMRTGLTIMEETPETDPILISAILLSALLFGLISLATTIWIFVLSVSPSQPFPNRYGPPPLNTPGPPPEDPPAAATPAEPAVRRKRS